MNSLTIYSVVTTQIEISTIHKALPLIDPPAPIRVVIVDNTLGLLNIQSDEYEKIDIIFNPEKLSLNANIQKVVHLCTSSYFMRVDSDDILVNLELINNPPAIPPFTKASVITCDYQLIPASNSTGKSKARILSASNVGFSYELLGAGVIASRYALDYSLKLSSGLLGQDNFALWLSALSFGRNYLDKGTHTYRYINSSYSLSSDTTRIISERKKLLACRSSELSKTRPILAIVKHSSGHKRTKKSAQSLFNRLFGVDLFVIMPTFHTLPWIPRLVSIRILGLITPSRKELYDIIISTDASLLILTNYSRTLYNNERICRTTMMSRGSLSGAMIVGI